MFNHSIISHRRGFRLLFLERLEDRVTPGYTPTQIKHAYGFDMVAAVNGTTLTGAGQTIAIVDAYYDATALSDLTTFDNNYGVPAPPSFTQVNQTGGSPTSLSTNSGWAGETALDIEWAHAIAPGANILLVEASSSSTTNLNAAVDFARKYAGVSVVSMSWGGGESSGETSSSSNNHYTTPSNHNGVSFFASSGDTGGHVIYPSASPNVVSVGGTTLNLSNGNYGSETAWSSGGGGASAFVSKPSYQTVYSGTMRGTPDVSYDSNPSTGFYTINNGSLQQVGGTSDAAPQWAALVALANQGRSILGLGTLDGPSQLLPALYSMPSTNFHDITSGSNGNAATVGYDLATGLGTPKAQLVIASLIAYGTTAPSITMQPINVTVNAGSPATFSAAANGTPAPSVQWQVSTNGGATWSDIGGATNVSYTTVVTDASQNGNEYRAVFTNIDGSVSTNAVTLTVNASPSVTGSPGNQTVTAGQSVAFSASATGSTSIQWQVSTNGGATFSNISGATSGVYSFTATLANNGNEYRAVFTNGAGSTNSTIATLTVNAPTTVADIHINDGSAQRSEVWSITVTFSGPVFFANNNPAAAFQLLHIQSGNNVVLSSAVTTDEIGRTVVTLTFSGVETDPVSALNGGLPSLADGSFQLTILAAAVTDVNGAALDGTGGGTIGTNYVSPTDTAAGGPGQLRLYRLFGDVNGDGFVNPADLGLFRAAYNASIGSSAYLAYLDSDNSGVIGPEDLGQFRSHFNGSVFN
jgi:subtilase family serine protease